MSITGDYTAPAPQVQLRSAPITIAQAADTPTPGAGVQDLLPADSLTGISPTVTIEDLTVPGAIPNVFTPYLQGGTDGVEVGLDFQHVLSEQGRDRLLANLNLLLGENISGSGSVQFRHTFGDGEDASQGKGFFVGGFVAFNTDMDARSRAEIEETVSTMEGLRIYNDQDELIGFVPAFRTIDEKTNFETQLGSMFSAGAMAGYENDGTLVALMAGVDPVDLVGGPEGVGATLGIHVQQKLFELFGGDVEAVGNGQWRGGDLFEGSGAVRWNLQF